MSTIHNIEKLAERHRNTVLRWESELRTCAKVVRVPRKDNIDLLTWEFPDGYRQSSVGEAWAYAHNHGYLT